jgi:hypothetical protein
VPGGGLVPWPQVFGALAKLGGDYHVMLETYNTSLRGFAHERGFFRNLCPDGDRFVRSALPFLKRCLGAAGNGL